MTRFSVRLFLIERACRLFSPNPFFPTILPSGSYTPFSPYTLLFLPLLAHPEVFSTPVPFAPVPYPPDGSFSAPHFPSPWSTLFPYFPPRRALFPSEPPPLRPTAACTTMMTRRVGPLGSISTLIFEPSRAGLLIRSPDSSPSLALQYPDEVFVLRTNSFSIFRAA